MSRSDLAEGALSLAARGFPVISLRPRSKVPIHANWPKLGMFDPDSIRIEWNEHPDANVGVLGGPGALRDRGLVILDVDLPDGVEALRALEQQHGDLPTTATVRTPSGGRHFYFTGHCLSWNPAPGLEVRSQGRQCAAPPSTTADGAYRWITDPEFMAPVPRWMQVPVKPAAASTGKRERLVERADRDPVLNVDPPAYFCELTGLVPDRAGFVLCPLHAELEPSCKVWPTADRGWFCFGCNRGGDVITLAAHLAGIETPVTGQMFTGVLDYLAGRLL